MLPGHQDEFEEFSAGLHEAVQPKGAREFDLFTQRAHASWKLRRCRRAEVQIFHESARPDLDPMLAPETEARLRGIQTYAQRAERTYHKALKELKALQSARAFQGTHQYEDLLADSDSVTAAPLSEQHQFVGLRMALTTLEIEAKQAQADQDIAAILNAPLPGVDPNWRARNARPASPDNL